MHFIEYYTYIIVNTDTMHAHDNSKYNTFLL